MGALAVHDPRGSTSDVGSMDDLRPICRRWREIEGPIRRPALTMRIHTASMISSTALS
jgi:hypothetical protein